PYALADPALVSAWADRVDLSGAVVMRNLEFLDGPRSEARPGLPVGGVDGRDPQPDAHLAGPGLRPLYLGDLEDLAGGARACIDRGLHVESFLPWRGGYPRP